MTAQERRTFDAALVRRLKSLDARMSVALAKDVAMGADALGISSEEFGVRAVQVLLRSMFGAQKVTARRRAKRRTVVGR